MPLQFTAITRSAFTFCATPPPGTRPRSFGATAPANCVGWRRAVCLLACARTRSIPGGEIALQPGDRLLLYTDGVLEATNGAGQAFGELRLQSVIETNSELSAERFSHLLLDEVRSWSGPNRQFTRSDDITFLVIDFR